MFGYFVLAVVVAIAFAFGYWWRGRQESKQESLSLTWQPLTYEPINMELFRKLPDEDQVRFARDYFAKPDGILTMQGKR